MKAGLHLELDARKLPENAAALAEQGWAVHKKEEGQIRDILAGKGFPRPFVDATLEQLGVEYVD